MFRNSAHVYDLIYEASGKDYAAEARDLHQQIKARAPDAVSLLDVACGTGGHLVHLRQWYDVVGVDLDPGMLEVAHGRLPETTLVEADMRTVDIARSFDVVVCLFSSIGYMATTDELDRAVENMARHLNPGGVLIVDGWVRPDAWRDTVSTHVETAASETVKVARCGLARRDGNKTHLEMHHLIATIEGIDHVVDHHDLTLFEPEQYREAFARAGLAVEETNSPMPDRDRYVGTRPQS
jgi:SAM-dependent methyltransferase